MTTYNQTFFKTIPTKDGALTRFALAITRRRPQNGWVVAAHCHGKVRELDVYFPDGVG